MNMTPDERDRLTRIETTVEYIKDNMVNLPAHPDSVKRIERLEAADRQHTQYEDELNKRIAWVVGAFTTVAAGLGYFGQLLWHKISVALWGN